MWTRLPCHPSHLTHIVSVSQPPSLRVRRGDLETADISDYSCYCSGDITLRMRKVLAIPPSLWLVCFSAEISVTIEYPCCAVAMKDFSRGKLSCTVYCSSPNLVPRSHSVFWSWEIWVRDYSSPCGTSLVLVSEGSLF